MLMLQQSRPYFRFLSLVTILTFFPSSVAVWNFIPPMQQVAEAEEVAKVDESTNLGADTTTPSPELARLSEDELRALKGGPLQLAKADNIADGTEGGRFRVADASPLPVAASLLSTIPKPKPLDLTEPETPDEPIMLAQGRPIEGPLGPPEAATALDNADALLAAGRYSDAAMAYIEIMDNYPATNESVYADRGIWVIMRKVESGEIGRVALANFENDLQTYTAYTAEGGYLVVTYYAEMAMIMDKKGDELARGEYANLAANWALQLIQSSSNHYLALGFSEYYYDVGELLGEQVLASFMAQLEQVAETMPPCLGRFGAYYDLALYATEHTRDWGKATIYRANMLNELTSGYLEDIFDDPNVYPWAKGIIGLAIGSTYRQLHEHDEALARLESTLTYLPDPTKTKQLVALAIAKTKAAMNPQNAVLAVEAYQDYIQAYPDGVRMDEVLLRLGGIYMVERDYTGALSFFRELIQRYPDSDSATMAASEIDFIMKYLYGTVEVAAEPRTPSPEEVEVAQMCGPSALRKLLEAEGVEGTEEELAKLAGTDETGTTMLGLVVAAKAKAVELTAIEAPEPDSLPQPFIAYVNGNHFLVVQEVRDDSVVVHDIDQPTSALTRAEFARMWDGKALVLTDEVQFAQVLNANETRLTKGGTDPKGKPPRTTPPTEPPCDDTGDCPNCGDDGDGRMPPWKKALTRRCKKNGQCSSATGSPNCPEAETGIWSPGVTPRFYPSSTTFKLEETDLSIPIRGLNDLTFGRSYTNEVGYHATHYTDDTKPWSNNLGKGWTHGLNMHLITSIPIFGKPFSVVFYDEYGMDRTYSYSSTSSGIYYYVRNATGLNSERGYSLEMDSSTGKFTLTIPGGREYHFSAATTDSNRFARLEKIADRNGNEISLDYDGAVGTGKLTKISPPSGDSRYLQLSYSGNQITKVELKKSSTILQTTTYAYNASDELTKITDDASNDVVYAYGTYASEPQSRFITTITDKAGHDTDFTYTFGYSSGYYEATKVDLDNAAGLRTTYDRSISTDVATVTNTKGSTTHGKYVYTPVSGDVARVQSLDYYHGNQTTYDRWAYEYVAATKALTKSTGVGTVVQETSYNDSGRLTDIQCIMAPCGVGTPGGGQTDVYYETASSLYPTKRTGPDGLDISYYYDSNFNITKVTHPSVAAAGWQTTYDAYGQVITKTDPLGHAATFSYDNMGNLTSATDPNSGTTTMYYDDYGNMTRITNPLSQDFYLYYAYVGCGGCGGSGGQITKVKNALNYEMEVLHDDAGNATKIIDALDGESDYAYDVMGRLTQVTSPSGSGRTVTMSYDDLGQMTASTDLAGKTTTYQYDHLGQVTKISDPIADTYVSYDALGNVSTVTDGLNHITTFAHDANNLLTKETYPDGKVVRYYYDVVGRMTKVGAGATGTIDPTEHFYDGDTGLMTKVRYTAGGDTSDAIYYYDGSARLTKLTDWIDGTDGLRFAYDAGDRLTTITDYDDSTLNYTYDAAGYILTMEDYHGSIVTYTYTDANQVSTITAPGGKTWTYVYNALGQPTEYSHPNGTTTTYRYDSQDWLTKIEHKNGANVLDSFYYALNDNGNITRTTYQNDEYWDYWYDDGNHLTKAERRDDTDTLLHRFTYTYDDGDNMTTKEIYDGTDTDTYIYAYTVANELTKQTLGGTDTDFGYDAWGRMTSKSDGTYSASYYYDYDGLLTKVVSDFPGEGTVEYEYGADEMRRKRISGGTTTWYNYDIGWGLLNSESGTGTLEMTYVHDPVKGIGTVLADFAGTTPATGTVRYYYQDYVGSTRRLRDADGDSLGMYEYEAFGSSYYASGASSSAGFTGHTWDDTAKAYLAPYRFYAPELGRWTSRDPLGMADSANVYAYAMNSPLVMVDPLGLFNVFEHTPDWFNDWFGGHRGDFPDRWGDCMDNCEGPFPAARKLLSLGGGPTGAMINRIFGPTPKPPIIVKGPRTSKSSDFSSPLRIRRIRLMKEGKIPKSAPAPWYQKKWLLRGIQGLGRAMQFYTIAEGANAFGKMNYCLRQVSSSSDWWWWTLPPILQRH